MGLSSLLSLGMTFLYYLTVIGAILLILGWVRARFPGVGLVGTLLLSLLLSPFIGAIARYLPWWALLITGSIGAWQTYLLLQRLLGFGGVRARHRPVRRRPGFGAALAVVRRAWLWMGTLFVRRRPVRPPTRVVAPVRRPVRPATCPRPTQPAWRDHGGPWPDPM